MSDYFDRVEQQILRNVPTRAGHRWRFPVRIAYLAPAASALLAIAVAAVFLGVRGASPSGSPRGAGVVLVYRAERTAQAAVSRSSLERAVAVMRGRLRELGSLGTVRIRAHDEIVVSLPAGAELTRAEREIGNSARLLFYDWEANALTPGGSTVASKLLAQDPTALAISRGGLDGPGVPGAGSMSLYDAVRLASKQPVTLFTRHLSRLGPLYYLFGTGGSAACAAAATFYGVTAAPAGTHCLLAGPDADLKDIAHGLPPGVSRSDGRLLAVRQGTVVLQAVPTNFSRPPKLADPTTQFYVLEDNVALFGNDVTNPRQATFPGGSPDVQFGFTLTGGREFHAATAAISRRGAIDSPPGQALDQHFAVAVDDLLVTVPSIDFKTYPFGVPANEGADMTAGLTVASARALATELRLGALPIALTLISAKEG